MLLLQHVSYMHPNRELLFDDLNLVVNNYDKIALIGHNGVGKSTLFRIITGSVPISGGQCTIRTEPYYIPQVFGQFNRLTVAEALRIDRKLQALSEILSGTVTEENFTTLNDDWTLEERCREALLYWQLDDIDLNQPMHTLSGGQKTKVFLAGITIHQPELILLDEPSNHLDYAGRELLYNFIQSDNRAMIVISHDRKLLNLLDITCELTANGIMTYGGNYDFYKTQKEIENNALHQDIQSKEKALKKAKEKERETLERQQKLDAKGKGKQEKAGVARIMINTMRNKAENSTSKLKSVHAEKIGGITKELQNLRATVADIDKMKFGFGLPALHKGKLLFKASGLNYSYDDRPLWKYDLNIEIASGDRIVIKGNNGSGKTTLIQIILGNLQSEIGTIHSIPIKTIYIDQEYSLIDNRITVYEQAQQFNTTALPEHEIKMRLNRFLFTYDDWQKPCKVLSGGERMRLLLCGLTIGNEAPDCIVLDEPTNNLDLQNIEILTASINEYKGTLLVVSHDEVFLEQLHIEREIIL
ncbi:ABC-F family ATP-binding cassette domain-containing protein [Flavobacterium supellecticarium]|uniref:ABC-F family ATP-binding cassette domain-containing protein n=1 Tax=Flavobacterium supellecticarium TaxID=2565924 RepID=A0A4V6RWV0_9FLAO|nr:ABC-F family ATP-binding cassette domain-containing protein [Flavobacterium supellecticarium]THF51720.1 ABC-F family ATP-binding cassette domain-containing protein [Flavobacterium supellecticarium]